MACNNEKATSGQAGNIRCGTLPATSLIQSILAFIILTMTYYSHSGVEGVGFTLSKSVKMPKRRRHAGLTGTQISRGYERPGWISGGRSRDVLLPKGRGADGFVDYSSGTIEFDNATANVALLATVAQGTSTQERIGRKIRYKGIDVKWDLIGASATGTSHRTGRMAIVYDTQPGSSLPIVTDIYESMYPYSSRNEAGFERFRILKEFRLACVGNSTDNSQAANWSKFGRKYIKCNKEARFKTAGTGAIGDISMGALYLVWMASEASASSTTVKISGVVEARTHFKDQLG